MSHEIDDVFDLVDADSVVLGLRPHLGVWFERAHDLLTQLLIILGKRDNERPGHASSWEREVLHEAQPPA